MNLRAAGVSLMQRPGFWLRTLAWVALGLFGLTILTYAVNGLFSRFLADEYQTSAILRQRGFIDTQVYWYTQWKGAYAFFFFLSLAELIGVRIVPWLPAVALALWVLGVLWLVFALLDRRWFRSPRFAALLVAGAVIATTLRGLPDIVQSLYWQTGMLTYLAPEIFFLFYLVFLIRQVRQIDKKNHLWVILASGLIPVILGGFAEVYVVVQTVLLAFGIGFSILFLDWPTRRRFFPWLAAGFAGSMLSMALILLAPGNSVRQALFTPNHNPFVVARVTLASAWHMISATVTDLPLMAAILAVPALVAFFTYSPSEEAGEAGAHLERHIWMLLLLIPAAVGALLIASALPSALFMGVEPFARVVTVPYFFFMLLVACWGWLAGMALRRSFRLPESGFIAPVVMIWVLGIGLLGLGPGFATYRNLLQFPVYRDYALRWDQRDQALREAGSKGERRVVVPELVIDREIGDLRLEPDFWINQVAADYYGLEQIIAKP